jgi:hypothetical protein
LSRVPISPHTVLEAARKKIPIVPVGLTGLTWDVVEMRAYINDLEARLEETNPPALRLLREIIGMHDLAELRDAVCKLLDEWEGVPAERRLTWNPHVGNNAMLANLKDVVEAMAAATGRTVAWRTKEDQHDSAHIHLGRLCRWCSRRGGKLRPRDPEIFVSVALHESASHGRVLKSELALATNQDVAMLESPAMPKSPPQPRKHRSEETPLGAHMLQSIRGVVRKEVREATGAGGVVAVEAARNEEDAEEADARREKAYFHELERAVEGCSTVLLLLTKDFLHLPECLLTAFYAIRLQRLVVTVNVDRGGYDYANAARLLDDLEAELSKHHPAVLATLRRVLPEETSVADVQAALRDTLPNIIAISWCPTAGKNHMHSVVQEILGRVNKFKIQNLQPRVSLRTLQTASVLEKSSRVRLRRVPKKVPGADC